MLSPTPAELWHQADEEAKQSDVGSVASARGARYRELMRKHGYLIDRQPGDDSPLFPCGYDPRAGCSSQS
jgi:hypothetical protein